MKTRSVIPELWSLPSVSEKSRMGLLCVCVCVFLSLSPSEIGGRSVNSPPAQCSAMLCIHRCVQVFLLPCSERMYVDIYIDMCYFLKKDPSRNPRAYGASISQAGYCHLLILFRFVLFFFF